MNIFFDARYTRTDFHDGISRYSAELGNALLRLTPVTFIVSEEGQKQWFPKDTSFITIHPGTSPKEPFTALMLNKLKPDVVYSPMQTMGTLGRRYKSVLTVHDLIYYRHGTPPRNLPWHVRFGWRLYHAAYWPQRLVLKGADIVTAVSVTTKNDMEHARLTNKHITIVPNAPQAFSSHPVVRSETVEHLVYMGSFMPYKNVETLIRGMQWLPGRTLHLLSRISEKRKKELARLIPANASVVFHNGVSDDTYEQLLANKAALVTASLDEGYGIPVAEALKMGVPAIISDIAVFHEVAGEGALYFDPRSPEAFAEQVKKLDSPAVQTTLTTKGTAHIQRFSWDASAQALYDAINQAV